MREPLTRGLVRSVERLDTEATRREALAQRVIPFNISYLDDCCLGIYPTDLIVMSAASGAGKTTLGALLAQKASENGRRVEFFALEAHKDEIEQRMLFREMYALGRQQGAVPAGFTFQRWMYGHFDEARFLEARAKEELAKKLLNCSTYYRETSFSHEDITRTFLAARDKTDLIVLDHLHYVDLEPGNENSELRKVVKAIRDAALDLEIPVVVVAHLRKKDSRARRILPDIDDIHGSSDIVKIATKVVLMAPARGAYASSNPGIAATFMHVAKDRFAGVNGYAAMLSYDLGALEYKNNYQIGRLTPGCEGFEDIDKKPAWAKHGIPMRIDEQGNPR